MSGELEGHGLADGEQRVFEADQEQGKPKQDTDQAGDSAAQVGQPASQDEDLEQGQDGHDGRHVEHRGQNGGRQSVQKVDHRVSIP